VRQRRKRNRFFVFLYRILTAREKRLREKFHNESELQAYEKRLQDVEQKIRSLVKRGMYFFAFACQSR